MKVLLVSPGVFPLPPLRGGGSESHVWGLARHLAERQVEVHLVSDLVEGTALPANLKIHPVHSPAMSFDRGFYGWAANLSTGSLLASRSTFKALSNAGRFDAVHFHEAITPIALRLFSSFKAIRVRLPPILCTVHSPLSSFNSYQGLRRTLRTLYYSSLLAKGWSACDHLIGSSKDVCRDLINTWRISSTKVSYVPQGVDTDRFRPGDPNGSAKNGYFDRQSAYCIFVGSLAFRKGPDLLLRAISNLECNCLIVGSGPMKSYLVRLAHELGLSTKVRFTGPVTPEQLVHLYRGAEFFVFPSRSEGAAVAPLEAMASGLPVVMTDVPGARDYVIPGLNGLIVDVEDVRGLRAAIKLLMTDETRRRKMSTNARRLAEERFSWKRIAELTEGVYAGAIRNTQAALD